MQIQGHDIAVCSWSLQPKSMGQLVSSVKELGLSHMQLAMAELAMLDAAGRDSELGILQDSGIRLTGGMLHFKGEDYSSIARIRQTGGFIPNEEWDSRRTITAEVAKLSRSLGCSTILAHVGFVPPHSDPQYKPAIERVREVAKIFADQGQTLIMETGQEPAGELLKFMHDLDRSNVKINFDPANMILYGAGDPIEAIAILGRHIAHIHVKDAVGSSNPGVDWGEEVPFGTGNVGPVRFLRRLKSVGYAGPLAIEREAGNDRMGDIKYAVQTLQKSLPLVA